MSLWPAEFWEFPKIGWVTPSMPSLRAYVIFRILAIVKFDNFVFKGIFAKLISREGMGNEIGIFHYRSRIVLLTVQSKALLTQRASSTDRILDRPHITAISLIGIRNIADEGHLFLILKKRPNLPPVPILMWRCFFAGSFIGWPGLFPIRDFWTAVRRSTNFGGLLPGKNSLGAETLIAPLKRRQNRYALSMPNNELYAVLEEDVSWRQNAPDPPSASSSAPASCGGPVLRRTYRYERRAKRFLFKLKRPIFPEKISRGISDLPPLVWGHNHSYIE